MTHGLSNEMEPWWDMLPVLSNEMEAWWDKVLVLSNEIEPWSDAFPVSTHLQKSVYTVYTTTQHRNQIIK